METLESMQSNLCRDNAGRLLRSLRKPSRAKRRSESRCTQQRFHSSQGPLHVSSSPAYGMTFLLPMQVNPYKLHRLEEGPEREVETTKGELLQMFRSMYQVLAYHSITSCSLSTHTVRG